ncbi:flagellar protein FliT [Bordetella holmesii]|nr:flagellar protein FliT [Bordetella holmesii]AHV93848.1 flagellar FliT family protein [Bordetella holmesii ATCC 51541]AIT28131.1 flagellar FliT family protein [Bordetella holmesii 44057]EWM40916.1 flagellar FliT family protein [Bordetella holmesii 35009]EWM42448.1 flagellar FliT family protein [Bordetella holmesii 41130]AMD47773.1 flagellar assembly protein FliT [Bordetella holmesii F627]
MTALMQQAPVLDLYQDIASVTGEMLVFAQDEDWTQVLDLGRQYIELVEQLRGLEPASPLDDASRAMKYELLVRILENDAAVRDLALPQLARLGDLLGRMKRQQSLLATYGGKARSA